MRPGQTERAISVRLSLPAYQWVVEQSQIQQIPIAQVVKQAIEQARTGGTKG